MVSRGVNLVMCVVGAGEPGEEAAGEVRDGGHGRVNLVMCVLGAGEPGEEAAGEGRDGGHGRGGGHSSRPRHMASPITITTSKKFIFIF